MSDSRASAGTDRLPWLADEPKKKSPSKLGRSDLVLLAVVALIAIAGAAFWMGSRSLQSEATEQSGRVRPSATMALPEARSRPQLVHMAPQPEVTPSPAPEVRPAPVSEVHYAPPTSRKLRETASEKATASEAEAADADTSQAAGSSTTAQAASEQPAALKAWQPRLVEGAAGRLVEVGAFGSVAQAKVGWKFMVGAYPAMAHLPALVRPDRNSKGRMFYRFRVGTTSQAHSEVLCQRMGKIHLSCAVVGLPWKAKVER